MVFPSPPPPPPPPPPLLKKPITTPDTDDKNKYPNPTAVTTTATITATPTTIIPSAQDTFLSSTTHLARPEVLKRRIHNLKQLSKVYRDHYWSLMEDLRNQYRDYMWKYGLSPYKEDNHEERECANETDNGVVEGTGESNASGNNHFCVFYGCKLKAMALTSFCHLHILSDSKQQLYKPCDYVIKSAQAGPITCGKPIMQATVPSLCNIHFQKAQKHVTRALKKAGLNVSSSNKLAPKFHAIVAEYVREIQGKRRAELTAHRNKIVAKHARGS